MPGVAGAGVDGATCAGLFEDLCCCCITALCAISCAAGPPATTAGAGTRAGATVALEAWGTAAPRRDIEAPRSTQRSGSSGQPLPANADAAHTSEPAITAV